MRLILSATTGDEPVDVVVECATGATVRDLAAALAAALPAPRVVPRGSGHLGLVHVGTARGTAPELWFRGAALDPDEVLESGPLRHGALVGLGQDARDAWAEPSGVVEVHLASGSGAGRVHRLAPGLHRIGSARTASICLDAGPEVVATLDVDVDGAVRLTPEPGADGVLPAPVRRRALDGPIVVRPPERPVAARSRRYATKLRDAAGARAAVREVDPEADRPYLHLDRSPVSGTVPWLPGQGLVVGDVLLEVAPVLPPDASLSPSPGGATLDYNRQPRLLPPPRTTEFRLPPEPKAPARSRFPLAMMIGPIVLGAAMYWFLRQPYVLLIMGLSPVMAVSNWVSGRRAGRREHLDAVRSHAERAGRVEAAAYQALADESSARRREMPDPATTLLTATGPRVRLWERRPADPDWLLAGVGTADVPSEVSLNDPARDDHERILHWTAADVPVGVPLARAGVTGVAGPADERRRLAAWMVAQVVTSHSPSDVSVVLLAGAEGEAWQWLRWLPHLRRDSGPVTSVGNDDETIGRRIAELLDLVERRRAAKDAGAGTPSPVLVVLDGARRIRLLPGLVTLLRDGPALGVLFLCVDDEERHLPEECRAVIRVAESTTVTIAGERPVDGIRADLVDHAWLERLGRALAPVRDVSSEDLASTLPVVSRLLDVLRLDPPRAEALVQGWARGGRSTRAVIGETAEGPFAVDLRADGPHGLVAGTTGSGKSELLQTLIASLAVENRPDEMTFVLIDYKGGAAFKDCRNLPHTVGMVTDLDAHLTARALESLSAELRRREHQLAAVGAKDIEDYLAVRGPRDAPMPRLLLVIDEFAALVAELPDFVSGLVDIARRGRSLGVHLLLATQRPAGVVSAEIKSNTNLRIALRVTDRNDSQDVIESGEAAQIAADRPGRGYARLGHASLIAFQSSRVGGRPTTAATDARVRLAPLRWSSLGRPVDLGQAAHDESSDLPTDLATLVTALREAARTAGVPTPPSPWLPALEEVVVDLSTAHEGAAGTPDTWDASGGDALVLPYGLVDLPAEQRRAVATLDLDRAGNLAVVGAARSGRSTVLRALAAAVGERTSPRDVHLYGVDCGNNALLPLVALPHTGAVVSRDQPDRLARLTRRLRAEISRRQQVLAERAFADVGEQRAGSAAQARLPYLLVLLDRWEGFLQAFEDYDGGALLDLWTQILQEGPGAGVRVVVTGDRSLLSGRVSTLTEDRLMLRMNDPGDFTSVGLSPRQVPDRIPDGRAFRSPDAEELQVRLLDPDPSGAAQVAALQGLGTAARDRWSAERVRSGPGPDQVPFRVDVLPARISLDEALAFDGPALGRTALPVGVGGDALRLFGLDAEDHGPGLLVVGPRRSGRSTTLWAMARSALDRGWAVGLVTPRRSPLRELAAETGVVGLLDLDSTKDEIAAVTGALVPGHRPSVLLVDDVELLGTDGALADAVVEHLATLRDRPGLVVAGGTADELAGAYRGPAPALKKSRCGLLLSPSTPSDGDLLGVRLPRSSLGGSVPGRGVLVTAGAWQLVQVPVPDEVTTS